MKGEGFVVRVGIQPGFAEILALATLVDRDDAMSFVVKAAGVDEGVVASVVQSRQVSLEEVGESGGEFVRMLLFVGLRSSDEFRSRHDTFQFGIKSSIGYPKAFLNRGNLTAGVRDSRKQKTRPCGRVCEVDWRVAYETMPRGLMVFQPPRVKSGHWMGMLPSFTDLAEISRIEDQSAASYTVMSGVMPWRTQSSMR